MWPPNNKGKKLVRVSHLTLANLVKAMIPGILTCQELADESGLHYSTVLEITKAMHRAGACYICDWQDDARGRQTIKVFKIGTGKDRKKSLVSSTEKSRRYRARLKAMAEINILGATNGNH